MVQSLWSDAEAREFVAKYASDHGEDMALRVYTSRLIGQDQDLVLHGGGNTSCKTTTRDLVGEELDVIAVKGSGHDLVDIEPSGLPFLEIEPLRRLMRLEALSDDEMVNEVRRQLLDTGAPNPSVEALLHAALPHKYVDHTHADAILILTNQSDGEAMVREALGDRVAILPWIMPGFPLAKAVAKAYADNPDVEGVVLLQHGIFTFGDDARASYERMIDLVVTAEKFADQRANGSMTTVTRGDEDREATGLEKLVQNVRGALAIEHAERRFTRMVCSIRTDDDLIAFSEHGSCADLLGLGPLTPNHLIRTKARYVFLTREQAGDHAVVRQIVADYADRYRAYFDSNKDRLPVTPTMLDPHPRVVVVEGVGILAFGRNKVAAEIAGDVAEHTLRAKARASAVGSFTELSDAELFEMEYWPLERRKVDEWQPRTLEGQIAIVTGGSGGIGYGVCESLAKAGAAVAVADIDGAAAQKTVDRLRADIPGAALLAVTMDVTDAASVAAGFSAITVEFGGVDIVVPNAGIAHVSTLRDMTVSDFERVLSVNLTGTMIVLHEAAKVFQAQGSGGSVIVQASKNVFAPGGSFGAYSASKAGQHQLGKIAALELAEHGVRVNMINADAVFGDAVPSGLWAEVGPDRMKSRGLDEQGLKDYYRDRSLLKVTVTPTHVGDAVVFLASDLSSATTGVTFTVDGGVAAAFPR
jgi:rhamnulose-1-phosphate aldolase/alcohol dehydrogenase